MYGALYAAEAPAEVLTGIAREFSPRLEVVAREPRLTQEPVATLRARRGGTEVVLDLEGLDRLFGDAKTIAMELRRVAAERGVRVRVAVAPSRTAACLLVHHRVGVTVIASGQEADALAPLPIALLTVLQPWSTTVDLETVLAALRRWGVKTLGEFTALPAAEVAVRLGQDGVAWQRLARGEDPRPLLPSVPEERFEQALDLEWPIEGLEPLSFVLGRLLEPLSAHLERRGRGAAMLHVELHLVTRTRHERTLELPTPIRDARTLRTLAVLDLESHPPDAAIDRVVVRVDPTPARVVQLSLITRPLPTPEQLSTLVARLQALMGEGRCGAPADSDSWQPGAFGMQPFAPRDRESLPMTDASATELAAMPAVALRRFRFPVPARVQVHAGKPMRVVTDRHGLAGGRVAQSAGPWRTSGGWWLDTDAASAIRWDRDEWDVTLTDGGTYRVYRERNTGHWFLDGIVD